MILILELIFAIFVASAACELRYNCSDERFELSNQIRVFYDTSSLQEVLLRRSLHGVLGPIVSSSRGTQGDMEGRVHKLGLNFNINHPKPKPKPTSTPHHDPTAKSSSPQKRTTTPKPPPNPQTSSNPQPTTPLPIPVVTTTTGDNSGTTQPISTPRPVPVVTTTTPEGRKTTNRPITTPEGLKTTNRPITTPEGRRTTDRPITTPEGRKTTDRPTTTPEQRRTTNRPITTPEERRTTTPERRRTTPPPAVLDLELDVKETGEQLIIRIRQGEDDGFKLSISSSLVRLTAGSLAGALRGMGVLGELVSSDGVGGHFLPVCEVQ